MDASSVNPLVMLVQNPFKFTAKELYLVQAELSEIWYKCSSLKLPRVGYFAMFVQEKGWRFDTMSRNPIRPSCCWRMGDSFRGVWILVTRCPRFYLRLHLFNISSPSLTSLVLPRRLRDYSQSPAVAVW